MNEAYITNSFLLNLFEEIQPEKTLLNCDISELAQVRADKRRMVREILKLDEIEERFGQELSFETDGHMESMGLMIDKYKVHAVRGLDFPVYHVKPDKPNGKTILYLHGHDDLGIVGALLDRTDKVRYHRIIPVKLALEGYDVIAPEVFGLGEAGFYGFPKGEDRVSGCLINARYLSMADFSLAGMRAYEAAKTIDMIEKMGLNMDITAFGISGGGMGVQQLSAVDDRVQRLIVACYANTYQDSILAKEHCPCNFTPGMLKVGDSYHMLALSAPKPMLTVNGLWDRGFPEAGSRKAFEYLEQVYARFGAADEYRWQLIEGKHEIHEDVIMDWLAQHA